uniref:C-type lectin domain-containing protein n=1 Tax=Monopterus albus TaxID=43700 RepID=A0A3Q3ITG4_MONAL
MFLPLKLSPPQASRSNLCFKDSRCHVLSMWVVLTSIRVVGHCVVTWMKRYKMARINQLCYLSFSETAQNKKTYMFISSPLTWADAQSYCRQHYTDLATIESSAENSALYSTIPNGVNVWIGLYRNAWTWSDNSSSVFRNWKSGQPDNSNLNEYCVSEDSQHQWYDDNCQNQYAFICHEEDVSPLIQEASSVLFNWCPVSVSIITCI